MHAGPSVAHNLKRLQEPDLSIDLIYMRKREVTKEMYHRLHTPPRYGYSAYEFLRGGGEAPIAFEKMAHGGQYYRISLRFRVYLLAE